MADHYATLEDVNGLVPQVPFTSSSKPSDAAVTAIIASVAQRMDGALANLGYTTPITTGTKALALLREACAWGALGLAQQIRYTAATVSVNDGGRPTKNIWLQMFDDWMKRLTNCEFDLLDAARTDAQLELRSSVQSVDDDIWLEPEVSRSQVL